MLDLNFRGLDPGPSFSSMGFASLGEDDYGF